MSNRRMFSIVGVMLLAMSAISRTNRVTAQGSGPSAQGSCPISGLMFRTEDFEPASGVTVLALSGGSTQSDSGGNWTIALSPGQVTLRVVTMQDIAIVVLSSGAFADADFIDAGTAEVVMSVSGSCAPFLSRVQQISRYEGPVSRPDPPALPAAFVPSATTLATLPSAPTNGNASNIPWIGYFWQTAPVVRVGLCNVFDGATQSAVSSAIDHWQQAPGFGWKLVRDDDACKADAPLPKLLITREASTSRFSRFILGSTPAVDMDGNTCKVDLAGSVCWVGTVTIKLNPAGFDRVSADQKVATVLHEMGHAFGLAHARGCGDTVMWDDTSCRIAPRLYPGTDDIASLNELLGVTVRTLQAAPARAPLATPAASAVPESSPVPSPTPAATPTPEPDASQSNRQRASHR